MTSEETKAARIIKKYQNRKLYDTQDSCYITLEEIAKLIQQGEDVTVIDNRSKKDVTSIILTQILVDQEKSMKSILPLTMLKEIIRSGNGSLFDFIRRYVLLGMESNGSEEARHYVERLVERGEITSTEGEALVAKFTAKGNKTDDEFYNRIKQVVEDSIRQSTNVGELEDKLSHLNSRLDRLEGGANV